MKRRAFLLLLLVITLASCRQEYDKFERPDWLEGKLYTELKTVPDVDSFIVCIERSGYDTIIDFSGSYTVFAPDNEAMLDYMSGRYSSVADIPLQEVTDLVKYHIIQNPWSRRQLQNLDVNGWIDRGNIPKEEPWGYKRQTLLRDKNKKYWISIYRDIATIEDSTSAEELRTVYTSSRKYVPIFFDEYMSIAKVSSSDFEDFFGRPYDPGSLYFGNARLGEEDYFAENGFIYKIDQVVNPLKNVEQLLEAEYDDRSYSKYLKSIYLFPRFQENLEETFNQEGAKEGLEVPTLYDLDYPSIVFDIHEELTGRDKINAANSIRYHYGIVAPTDKAMDDLIKNVITAESGYPHWASYATTPENVKRIIVNSHMSQSPIYLSDLKSGFLNGEDDSIFVDMDAIVDKSYASNATFYGLDKAVVPRAFSSVAGPVYLRPGYETFMLAIEFAKVLPAIKRRNADYSFFVVPDWFCSADSSLFASRNVLNPRRIDVRSITTGEKPVTVRRTEFSMTQQILNQIGSTRPSGVPRKEFIPNLAGNYIVYNSVPHPETGEPTVTGGVPSVWGYQGDSAIITTPIPLDEPTDNGITYEVHGWLQFPRTALYDQISEYPWFFELLDRAGMVDNVFYEFNFTTESDYYTIFLPTEEAFQKYNTDTLTTEELQQFLKYHFVRGNLIFTDGNAASGKYETLRLDESSTIYSTEYSRLDIRTGIDVLDIYDTQGNLITQITENDSTVNRMTAINLSNDEDLENYITNGVIHQIDTVLLKR